MRVRALCRRKRGCSAASVLRRKTGAMRSAAARAVLSRGEASWRACCVGRRARGRAARLGGGESEGKDKGARQDGSSSTSACVLLIVLLSAHGSSSSSSPPFSAIQSDVRSPVSFLLFPTIPPAPRRLSVARLGPICPIHRPHRPRRRRHANSYCSGTARAARGKELRSLCARPKPERAERWPCAVPWNSRAQATVCNVTYSVSGRQAVSVG